MPKTEMITGGPDNVGRTLGNAAAFFDRNFFMTPYDFGAKGNANGNALGQDDTDAFLRMFAAQKAARAALTTTDSISPVAGRFMGTVPAILLPRGIFDISDELTGLSSTLVMVSDSRAIIRQLNPAKRILVSTTMDDAYIRGVRFIGGSRHTDFRNGNNDSAQWLFDNCEFQAATEYSHYNESSVAAVTSAGTASVTAGSFMVTGAGTAFVAESAGATHVRIFATGSTSSTYYIGVITKVIDNTHVKIDIPAPANLSGVAIQFLDNHISPQILFSNCRFYKNAKIAHLLNDATIFFNTWLYADRGTVTAPGLLVADTAQINFMGESIDFLGSIHVGGAGIVGDPTRPRLSAVRLVDMRGVKLSGLISRVTGGEEAGMSLCHVFRQYVDTPTPNFRGASIIMNDEWQLFAGPAAGAAIDKGLIHLRGDQDIPNGILGSVPQFIKIKGNFGQYSTPVVQSASSTINLTTFYGNVLLDATKVFRYDFYNNYTDGGQPVVAPSQMLAFSNPLFADASVNFGNVLNGTYSGIQQIACLGARPLDGIAMDLSPLLINANNILVMTWITNDNVNVRVKNESGVAWNIGAVTLRAVVTRKNWHVDA